MEMNFVNRVEQRMLENEARAKMLTMPDRFEKLLKQMAEDDKGKFDFQADLKNIRMDSKENGFVVRTGLDEIPFDMTNNAFSQMMTMLGIPVHYARKLPWELLQANFEYWKEQVGEKDLFIRAKHLSEGQNRVRAFLTPSYNVLDNRHVLEAFQTYMDRGRYKVVEFHLDDDHFNSRLVFPGLVRNDIAGPNGKTNPFFAGLHISNGETGRFSVTVDLIIYEQWCSNGAVRRFSGRSLVQRKHIGQDISLVDLLANRMSGVELMAEQAMEQFTKTAKVEVKHPIDYLQRFMQSHSDSFPKEFREAVIRAYEMRPMRNLYGVVSSLTQAAQVLPVERRMDVEVLAGKLVEQA